MTTFTPHMHQPANTFDVPFTGPVTCYAHQNRQAHGGICRIETCSCGVSRHVNVNGRHREIGAWDSEEVGHG